MQRKKHTFPLTADKLKTIKRQMLGWAQQFSIFLFLDSNGYADKYGRFECILAVDPATPILSDSNNEESLSSLEESHSNHKDWLFGHICYDYKNLLESKLQSRHEVRHNYPQLYFFCPQVVIYIDKQCTALTIESLNTPPEDIFQCICNHVSTQERLPSLSFTSTITQQDYIETIESLRQHIADGDCYEINFCNEGFCENVSLIPISVFQKLQDLSPAPFSAFYRINDLFMVCASPERYLLKHGDKIVSQPIKGTARRDNNERIDELIKNSLQTSVKERAENVMIVDLIRNDLARSCEVGSIQVEELFGIYSFPQVHQMISTISGILKNNAPFTNAIKHSFPMGSMTGAPKIKVMQLIDKYELSKRELFSGTVGYITPDQDFDFNVIIRSLFYNATTQYLSYHTGGAITYDSDPQQEWEEMRLKAWALERIFSV